MLSLGVIAIVLGQAEFYKTYTRSLFKYGCIGILLILFGCSSSDNQPTTIFTVTYTPADSSNGRYNGVVMVTLPENAIQTADGDSIRSAELRLFAHRLQVLDAPNGTDKFATYPRFIFYLPLSFVPNIYQCSQEPHPTVVSIYMYSGKTSEMTIEICPDHLQVFVGP